MGVFYGRPFAGGLLLFIASVVSVYAVTVSGILTEKPSLFRVLFTVIFLFITLISIILIVFAIRAPRLRIRLVTILLAICFFVIGFFRAGDFFFESYLPAQELIGERITVTATVRERETSSAGYARYRVFVSSVFLEGEEISLKDFSAVLTLDTAGAYAVGDRIAAEVTGCALSDLYRDPSYSLADGAVIGFLNEENTEPTVLADNLSEESFVESVTEKAGSLQQRLSFVLSEGIRGEVGALASAVLLGDKSGLSGELTRDFGRSGISHMFALSGLHMSILIGGVVLLLRRLTLHRRIVSILTIPLIFGYLLLTGFSLSAVRAGLMLLFVLVLGFFSRTPDSVTSLFLAVSAILFIVPSAVASVGLWMSFSAVFGLLVLMPRLNELFHMQKVERKGPLYYLGLLLRRIVTAVLVTVIASLSVLPVLYISGGEASLFSVITNLLAVFLMPFFLVLSLSFLLFFRVAFLRAAIGFILRLIGGFIISAARQISHMPNATVSLSYSFTKVAICVFLIPTILLFCVSPRFFTFFKSIFVRKIKGLRFHKGCG